MGKKNQDHNEARGDIGGEDSLFNTFTVIWFLLTLFAILNADKIFDKIFG